jgi:peptidoglycan/LPS O-acetylase OafA/YrhL
MDEASLSSTPSTPAGCAVGEEPVAISREIRKTETAANGATRQKQTKDRKAKLTERENNFGLLRITFATLVILTHSFYFVDGNALREPLVRWFHTLEFGDVAVDGFFIISGYLVTKSFLRSRSNAEYIGKRVLRIYPGYIMACAVSVLIGINVGATLPHIDFTMIMVAYVQLLLMGGVHLDHTFSHSAYPGVNGSLWSISYEFRCYLLLIVLGMLGAFRNKRIIGLLTVCFLFWVTMLDVTSTTGGNMMWGSLAGNVRTIALFLAGSSFFLFEDAIVYSRLYATASLAALLILLSYSNLATTALAVFGGYIVFWFALHGPTSSFSRATNQTDLSYGVYLYAWPIGELLVQFFRGLSPWLVFWFTVLIVYPVAFISWSLLEKPALGLKRFLTKEHGF